MYDLKGITLRPYQEQTLKELAHLTSIGLFLGTGSGKTLTALARYTTNPTENLLVICPQKVVSQWRDVIRKTMPNRGIVTFPVGSTAKEKNEALLDKPLPRIIIVNFEIIFKLTNLLKLVNEKWTIIVDESHKIKELGTKKAPIKVTQAVLELGKNTDYKIILTATPTQKDKGGYIDYFTQLKFLGYMDLSIDEFKDRYCIEAKLQFPGMPFPVKVIKDYKNTYELDNLLVNTCKRYTPKYNEYDPEHIQIKIDKCKSYSSFVKERVYKEITCDNVSAFRIGKKYLTGGIISGTDEDKLIHTYKDNTNKIEWLEEFINNTNEKMVIFYKYNLELAQLETLCEKLGKTFIIINGANKDKFYSINHKKYDIVLGQFGACGESVDGLQYKLYLCVFYSMPESSIEYKQAIGRIDRDGQLNVPTYYYLTMENTIDTQIYDMVQQKIDFNEEVLNKLDLEVER